MLDAAIRKVNQLHQAVVYHDKNVDKFDALSLATVEFATTSTGALVISQRPPELKGLNKIYKDINDYLNEGYIAEQAHLKSIRDDIDMCLQSLIVIRSNGQSHSGSAEDEVDPESNNVKTSSIPQPLEMSSDNSMELELLKKELTNKLRVLHESLVEIKDNKVYLLNLVKEILEHYRLRILEMGDSNGVLNVKVKAELTIVPKIDMIIRHKIFSVTEVIIYF